MADDEQALLDALTINSESNMREIRRVVEAINFLTSNRLACRGSVIVACVQVLSQAVVQDVGPNETVRLRRAVLTLFDNYFEMEDENR